MDYYSYHIFYFPFKWEVKGKENEIFSEQVDLDNIPISLHSMWERVQIEDSQYSQQKDTKEQEELFAERQYYYDFVHPALYDIKNVKNSIIHHYERREPKESVVEYHIKVKDKTYVLRLDALNVNLYSTGIGIMSFYLSNEKETQKDEKSIRDINQFGRRIMPPHCGEFAKDGRNMLADSIQILGLHGDELRYSDSFDYVKGVGSSLNRGFECIWQPAWFIKHLIEDLSSEMKVTPVIDDRMLVNCWYGNDDLANEIKTADKDEKIPFLYSDLWYKHLFVDNGSDATCQNEEMKKRLLKESTYSRWQKYGTLYGLSRYSMVLLTDTQWFAKNVLAMHMRTIYSRMFELVIIQRASMLRFSGEVTKVSALKGDDNKVLADRIASLYKEYIRFINQIYFRSVTAQDQGIEMYEMLLRQFDSDTQIKDLDEEISELHQYVSLVNDQRRNENGEILNILATIFLPATLLTGVFGMNSFKDGDVLSFAIQILLIVIITIASIFLGRKILKNRRK